MMEKIIMGEKLFSRSAPGAFEKVLAEAATVKNSLCHTEAVESWTQRHGSSELSPNSQHAKLKHSPKPASKTKKSDSRTKLPNVLKQRTMVERRKQLASFLQPLMSPKHPRKSEKQERRERQLHTSASSPDFRPWRVNGHRSTIGGSNSLSHLADPYLALRISPNARPPGPSASPGDSNNGGDFKCPLPLLDRVWRWITKSSSIDGKEIRNILVLGVSFQLIFTAYYATQVGVRCLSGGKGGERKIKMEF